MKQFKISIPKPCHKDWSKMTPKEKGRFCASCSKTVVDFTQKSTEEIQEYLIENYGKRVCGHFYRKQLDSVVLQIPETTFQQQLSFQKLFILVLLFVMGTTLFSCKTDTGKVQKIDKIELIDTIVKTEKTIDTIIEEGSPTILGELPEPIIGCKRGNLKSNTKLVPPPLDNIVEVTGDIQLYDESTIGELTTTEIDYKPEDTFCHWVSLDSYPKFEKHKKSSNEDSKKLFNEEIAKYIKENFKIESTINLGLQPKKYRMLSKIEIDNKGNIFDIKVRAPHPQLKEYVKIILKRLPKFIPATKDGKNVSTSYAFPITFVIE